MPASILKEICSFLCNRSQRVIYNNVFSEWTSIPSGVPQGSVLGPILFALSIDNFKCVCSNTTIVKYADDITRCLATDNEDELEEAGMMHMS